MFIDRSGQSPSIGYFNPILIIQFDHIVISSGDSPAISFFKLLLTNLTNPFNIRTVASNLELKGQLIYCETSQAYESKLDVYAIISV